MWGRARWKITVSAHNPGMKAAIVETTHREPPWMIAWLMAWVTSFGVTSRSFSIRLQSRRGGLASPVLHRHAKVVPERDQAHERNRCHRDPAQRHRQTWAGVGGHGLGDAGPARSPDARRQLHSQHGRHEVERAADAEQRGHELEGTWIVVRIRHRSEERRVGKEGRSRWS